MDKTFQLPYLSKVDLRGDFQVWIVDGAYIRGHTDEESALTVPRRYR